MNIATFSYAREIPFTQDERDRLRNIELRLERVETKIEGIEKRIDDLRLELKGEIGALRDLIYVVIAGIFVLIGFVIWDRRTALAPAVKKTKELEERGEKIERALKELAEKDPKVAEVLKHIGFL